MKIIHLHVSFWHLSIWASQVCILLSDIIWRKFSVFASDSSYVSPFLLLLVFPLPICHTFCSHSTVLEYSVFFFFFSIFFLLLFSFVSLSWHVLKFRGSFFSHVSLQISRLKPTFTSIIVFLISSISLWFLKFSSLCLCYPSVIACCLLFSTKKLNVFIIVILNCQSDNSNMSAISDSGFDICSVSLSCFLIF